MKNNFYFCDETAREIFPKLVDAYKKREGIFRFNGIFPELPLPKGIEWGSYEHFNWWFVTVMSDHAAGSIGTYERSRKLHDRISKEKDLSNIFDPRIAASLDTQIIYETLYRMCQGANNHPEELKTNSIRLVTEYDGNPINIFKYMKDVNEAKEILMTFDRFADGLAGLYLTFLVKYGLVKFDNPNDLLVKVEHHDIRLSEALGILKSSGKISKEIAKPLSEFFRSMCSELGISIIDLDSALWAIGRYGCSVKRELHCKTICPVYSNCDREGMFGSYYHNGIMIEGDYWKSKLGQEILPFREDELIQIRLIDTTKINLNETKSPSLEQTTEQFSLF